MYSFRLFAALSIAVCFLTGFGTVSQAQTRGAVAATARVTAPVEAGRTVRLHGHVPKWATAANDLGSVSPTRSLDNLHLILARSPPVQAAFEQLLADQQNPTARFLHRTVHQTLFIIENPQADDFPAQPFNVLRRIGILDGQQDEQAILNRGFNGANDRHIGLAHPLNDSAHKVQSSGRSPLGAIFTSFGSNWPSTVTKSLCAAITSRMFL